MIRTQIQLPDPLYREVLRVARAQDWSIAEVIRRGAEAVVRSYPSAAHAEKWALPPPIKSTLLVEDPHKLRDLLRDEQDEIT